VEDDVFGHTVLYYAAACGYDDLCMVLLKKGGNPFIRDRCGQTILSYTKKTPRFDFEVRRLMKAR
jgi:ankyrin repeat protein